MGIALAVGVGAAALGVAWAMPMGTNIEAGMVASEATLTGISVVRSINSAMLLMLCLPGMRNVTEAIWLGSISLRSKGME